MNRQRLRCVIHAGMPKTGSSSIQEFLKSTNGQSTSFLYEAVKNTYLIYSFQSNIERISDYKAGFVSPEKFGTISAKRISDLVEFVEGTSLRHQNLLFSIEAISALGMKDLKRLKLFFESYGYTVEIILYIRPWYSRLGSSFQERIKWGAISLKFLSNLYGRGFYEIVRKFDRVFGESNVHVFKFDSGIFPNGDVVQHFCSFLGIPYKSGLPIVKNPSLSLSAVKLWFAYNKFGKKLSHNSRPDYYGQTTRRIFLEKMRALLGAPVRIHSELLGAVPEKMEAERPLLEARMGGVSMAEDLNRYDKDPFVIRSESDMYSYEPEALQWLADQVGEPPVEQTNGMEAAELVSAQVQRLLEQIRIGHTTK